ncbi:MAG TPA: sucrase ferredoxin, partial [Iamia sp.]|nr:sucrase ferredoxin [Iamia sp.]
MPSCAPWARAAGLDPAGSAPATPALVLVDWPLPWPRAADEIEALTPLAGVARVQLVVPTDGDDAAGRRVRAYARRPGRATYGRAEGRAPRDGVAALAVELLAAAAAAEGTAPLEVLVCAHGARDRCCGSLGTRLALAGGGEVTVERTSHLGGHRFAPTALTLPDGRYWAFLDPDVLAAVVRRDGPVGVV